MNRKINWQFHFKCGLIHITKSTKTATRTLEGQIHTSAWRRNIPVSGLLTKCHKWIAWHFLHPACALFAPRSTIFSGSSPLKPHLLAGTVWGNTMKSCARILVSLLLASSAAALKLRKCTHHKLSDAAYSAQIMPTFRENNRHSSSASYLPSLITLRSWRWQ